MLGNQIDGQSSNLSLADTGTFYKAVVVGNSSCENEIPVFFTVFSLTSFLYSILIIYFFLILYNNLSLKLAFGF